MSQAIRGQGGHLGFPIGPKNTILAEDFVLVFPCMFIECALWRVYEVKGHGHKAPSNPIFNMNPSEIMALRNSDSTLLTAIAHTWPCNVVCLKSASLFVTDVSMSRQIFGIHNIQKYNLFPEDRRGSFPDPSNPDREKQEAQKGHCRSPEYNERERNFGMEPKITLHPTCF